MDIVRVWWVPRRNACNRCYRDAGSKIGVPRRGKSKDLGAFFDFRVHESRPTSCAVLGTIVKTSTNREIAVMIVPKTASERNGTMLVKTGSKAMAGSSTGTASINHSETSIYSCVRRFGAEFINTVTIRTVT